MLRFLFIVSGLYFIAACTSQPTKSPLDKNASQSNNITLSHVRAYLLIGNVAKAEERFQTLDNPELNPNALLLLAELRAAQGDSLGAQQAFLQSIADGRLDKQQVFPNLLDYFCQQKKWPTLQEYAASLDNSALPADIKNKQLTTIGLCFFSEQHWQDAYDVLLKLDFNQQVEPFAYLALAHLNIEQKQYDYDTVKQLVDKFEATKTQVDPEVLWTSFLVYSALQQPQLAQQSAQQLVTLFPNNSFTRKYIILTKRNRTRPAERAASVQTTEQVVDNKQSGAMDKTTVHQIHIIKKGETLYQLSKRYSVSVADLLKWNPNLVVNDISLGTAIHVSE